MSGQNLRDVQVRRHIRPRGPSHEVEESDEHDQGDHAGVAKAENTRGDCEGEGKEAGGLAEGVLWGKALDLWESGVYMLYSMGDVVLYVM